MKSTISVLAIVPLVAGHGFVTDPPARQAGDAMKAACGEQVFNQQKSDAGGNIQGELQVAMSQKDYQADQCNLFLCKGYQMADNAANVQAYTAGQDVPIKVDIRAPHTGVANVSVVDTKSNAIIGMPLINFDDYASNAHTIPDSDKMFTITMPDVAAQCGQAGNCVIQWWWDAPDIKQTYASCIDFTMGGGAAKIKAKRQDMESMTNGPTMTMTFSPMPMSSNAQSAEQSSVTPVPPLMTDPMGTMTESMSEGSTMTSSASGESSSKSKSTGICALNSTGLTAISWNG